MASSRIGASAPSILSRSPWAPLRCGECSGLRGELCAQPTAGERERAVIAVGLKGERVSRRRTHGARQRSREDAGRTRRFCRRRRTRR